MDAEHLLKAGERIDQLYSQSVQIIQSDDVFSFSMDAVLLANFVPSNHRQQLVTVDLCAGNGAVGLFLNAKLTGAIWQVEIQPRLADMAQRSVQLNQLTHKFHVLNMDIADVYQTIPKESADIVVCNPPYFPDHVASKKNPNHYLAIARHEIQTTLDEVVATMSGLLKMNAHGYLVHRPERLDEIMASFSAHRLAAKRIQFVHPKQGREANMVLIEVIKDGKPGGVRVLEPIVVQTADDEYTPEMQAMLYGK